MRKGTKMKKELSVKKRIELLRKRFPNQIVVGGNTGPSVTETDYLEMKAELAYGI